MKLIATLIPTTVVLDNGTRVPGEQFSIDLPLRDLFAAFALAGWLAAPDSTARGNPSKAAAWAYEHADALLAQREVKGER